MSDYDSEVHKEQREHHGKAQQKVEKQHPVNSNPKQQPLPPCPQHVVIGLNAFNSTAKLSNANWETTLTEEIQVNTGDSIFVKNAYIDTRLQTSQNILVEEDTIIELEYWFYYVNRGGSNSPSIYQDYFKATYPNQQNTPPGEDPNVGVQNQYITQQLRACELAQVLTAPKADGATTNYTYVNGLPFITIDGNNTTQRTIQNLAELTETIYYAPNNFPSVAQTGMPQSPAAESYIANLTEEQRRLNPMAFIMPQGINGGDGLPYLLQMVVPNATEVLPVPENVIILIYQFSAPTAFLNSNITNAEGNPLYTYSRNTGFNNPFTSPDITGYAQAIPNGGGTWTNIELAINVDPVTGKYSTGNEPGFIQCAGITVGDVFVFSGTILPDGISPQNDIEVTVKKIRPASVNYPVPGAPPNEAYEFIVKGSAIKPPGPNPLYKAPDRLIPFTKKWKMLIPAGSYTPDYLATTISRGMSIQKQKIQRNYATSAGNPPIMNTLITPTKLINSQFPPSIGIESNFGDKNEIYQATNLPDLLVGSFETNAPQPLYQPGTKDTAFEYPTGTYYQPNLNNASKNPKSYPDPPTSNFFDPPYDPDFNNPNLNDDDDCSFIFRPFAFTNKFPLSIVDMGFAQANRLWSDQGESSVLYTDVANFRLTLNDSNLQNYNSMPAETPRTTLQTFIDNSVDPCVDMIYTPFLTDVQSPFYYFTESGFDPTVPPLANSTPPNMKYGIKPIISTMNMVQLADIGPYPNNNNVNPSTTGGETPLYLIPDITSPIVGASEMSLEWNVENNNLFSFGFLHNPIYSKPNPDTNQTSASVAKYPSSYCLGSSLNPAAIVQGVFTADRQSGIIMKSMTSKTRSGKQTKNFWELLGFDVASICAKTDASGNPILTYRDYISKTTGGFSGTANIYNPEFNVRGNGEISYATYEDIGNFGGYYANFNPVNPFPDFTDFNFLPDFSPIYYAAQTTNSILAKTFPINDLDCGHVLIELQAWSLPFLNEVDYKEVKAIVSNYFVSQNSFLTAPTGESFQYFHIGPSMTISTIKVRILNPKNLQEYALLGPNSSVYVQFVKTPTLANIITGNSL